MTERFVAAIVAGGLALVAGLWTVELVPELWLAGVALAVLGVAGLAWGIGSELELR